MTAPDVPPAGWHPDPWGVAAQRYWDGAQWTGHVHGPAPSTTSGPDPALKLVLPVGRSGWAIASGYLGLFSVLVVFAPFALITGILGLRAIDRRPELWGRGRAWFGVIMGGAFCLPIVFLLMRAVITR